MFTFYIHAFKIDINPYIPRLTTDTTHGIGGMVKFFRNPAKNYNRRKQF